MTFSRARMQEQGGLLVCEIKTTRIGNLHLQLFVVIPTLNSSCLISDKINNIHFR